MCPPSLQTAVTRVDISLILYIAFLLEHTSPTAAGGEMEGEGILQSDRAGHVLVVGGIAVSVDAIGEAVESGGLTEEVGEADGERTG